MCDVKQYSRVREKNKIRWGYKVLTKSFELPYMTWYPPLWPGKWVKRTPYTPGFHFFRQRCHAVKWLRCHGNIVGEPLIITRVRVRGLSGRGESIVSRVLKPLSWVPVWGADQIYVCRSPRKRRK